MKRTLLLSLALAVSIPALAQNPIAAPSGWKTQQRAGGATTFTPPNLAVGEVFSITIYASAPLGGKTLETYLRGFAGPVGTQPGQLVAPLKINSPDARAAVGTGNYSGPNGAQLFVIFNAFSFDGRQVVVSRTLVSGDGVFARYKSSYETLLSVIAERAQSEASENLASVPNVVAGRLKPGGAMVPGIYVGEQTYGGKTRFRFRVYLYPSGEYRFKNSEDKPFTDNWGQPLGVGTSSYNRASGKLDLDFGFDMFNGTGSLEKDNFCFYGRNSAGKPAIYAERDLGFGTARTSLVWTAPLSKIASPSAIKARESAVQAEKQRYKFVVAPGRGVKASQIHAVWHDYQLLASGLETTVIDEAYLLLRDGTVHEGLPVPPDQLNVAASRAKAPKSWGKWRKTKGGYQVAWAGKAWEELKGNATVPGTPQMRLQGRYAAVRAGMNWHRFWGVTFDKTGRFSKDRRGGLTTGNLPIAGGLTPRVDSTYDDGGSGTTLSGGGASGANFKKRALGGDRAGTYSINGYTLTLRYDNGQIARLPFFFDAGNRKQMWFESDTLTLGLED